ncbi:hypothetical protein FACS189459_4050 [Bacilli bacterium]|nr:hypothetical protein FACS189459_4050 [Bacilli bacterium]
MLSKTARQCINVCNEYINDNNIWPKNYAPSYNKTILDFCIPYFISEMEFGYKGNLISGLSNDSS